MRSLYQLFIGIVQAVLPLFKGLNHKLRRFIEGRAHVFEALQEKLEPGRDTIWVHTASLGEYEQIVPVLQRLEKQYPAYQLLVTFFSPSGYEVKKENALANAVTYLPIDTKQNVKRFLQLVHPRLAIFVKYEFWPNYLEELKAQQVPTLLVSGVFREQQPFFKWYGRWMRSSLQAFDHFFLQDAASMNQLKQLGFHNATVSGDTRFDRVAAQLEMDNELPFLSVFKQKQPLLICGSTWPADDHLLLSIIPQLLEQYSLKVLIAPHEIKEEKIAQLEQPLHELKVQRYSQLNEAQLEETQVLILDTIGLLSRAYAYGDLAYVGGAAGDTGLHNILEPATFGLPILCGPHIEKFPEAQRLRQLAGLFTVADSQELHNLLSKLLEDKEFCSKSGMISGHFINSNTGATRTIMSYLQQSKILD
ncbi:3-deoxy-D-manno-octulosonic acid transferase [Croceiramulus getboli]|nr:glycosyltransferase N-terminal domain-containing protein [Flavobacteriaceae bacterium YJPT1-3]